MRWVRMHMIYAWREDVIRLDGDRLVTQTASQRGRMISVVVVEQSSGDALRGESNERPMNGKIPKRPINNRNRCFLLQDLPRQNFFRYIGSSEFKRLAFLFNAQMAFE
jgi:hypothetical protein